MRRWLRHVRARLAPVRFGSRQARFVPGSASGQFGPGRLGCWPAAAAEAGSGPWADLVAWFDGLAIPRSLPAYPGTLSF